MAVFNRFRQAILLLIMSLGLTGCMNDMPDSITPVEDFDSNRYLGKWYEIARLDHSFERGLDEVAAFYSLNADGTIKVLNSGFNTKRNRWETAEGKAYFPNGNTQGFLKVSFFGPFYGSYVVFDIDASYQRAYVSGPNLNYLWFLSRTPTVSDAEIERFKRIAQEKGFNTNELIFPKQSGVR